MTFAISYLFTGDCGYECGVATFYHYWEYCRRCVRRDMCQYSGERVRLFVPEDACPIHDNDKWWATLLKMRKHNPTWKTA